MTRSTAIARDGASQPAPPLQDRPSVWIHGAGMSGSTWDHMIQSLPLALAPDLPWHGKAAPVYPPCVERFADVLEPDIPEAAIVIGHSLGGMVALELAHRLGTQIAALVLVEAVPTVRDRVVGRVLGLVAKPVVYLLRPRGLAWMSGIGQKSAAKQELRDQLRRHDTASLLAAIDAAMAYDARPYLGAITIPVLVIAASQSPATRAGARLAAQLIPDAEFVEIEGGHIINMDNPGVLKETIDDFLARRVHANDT